ncbi:hypothetical protein GJ496_010711 [Pomphorhynchus laevis]|nr:hypothetical protein GJ496_010711 [Pomphorhynchus laevis]
MLFVERKHSGAIAGKPHERPEATRQAVSFTRFVSNQPTRGPAIEKRMSEIVPKRESNVRSDEIAVVDETTSYSHAQRPVGQCPVCRLEFRIIDAGLLFKHNLRIRCADSGLPPTSQRSSHSQSTGRFSQQPQAPSYSQNAARSKPS